MGRDHNEVEKNGGKPARREKKNRTEGCFIGISLDEAAKDKARQLDGNTALLNQIMQTALDRGLRISLRYDVKNDCVCATATRVGQRFEDNQTLGAFHSWGGRALAILMHVLNERYLELDDWRQEQLQFDLEW